VDGGVSSPVPVRSARSLGADLVIAVDISAKPVFQETDTMVRILLQTFAIMGQQLAASELGDADYVASPQVGELSASDFSSRNHAMAEGERAMRKVLPQIRAAAAGVVSLSGIRRAPSKRRDQ
jgi:NTE family protein